MWNIWVDFTCVLCMLNVCCTSVKVQTYVKRTWYNELCKHPNADVDKIYYIYLHDISQNLGKVFIIYVNVFSDVQDKLRIIGFHALLTHKVPTIKARGTKQVITDNNNIWHSSDILTYWSSNYRIKKLLPTYVLLLFRSIAINCDKCK